MDSIITVLRMALVLLFMFLIIGIISGPLNEAVDSLTEAMR